jgi:hypothetical protein
MTEEKPTAAFILSLIAGIFIILGGGVMTMMGSFLGSYGYGMMRYGGVMGAGLRMMGFGGGVMGVLGLVFGAIVIISAFMLNSKPDQHQTWGSLIVLFSALSIFGSVMGFGIGLVLGLIGGVLAITWQPTKSLARSKPVPQALFSPRELSHNAMPLSESLI